jgi:acetyl-CoA carboxylase carboxyltransferase component
MGLKGAGGLAYRRELAAFHDPVEREAEFRRRVALSYAHGKADEDGRCCFAVAL